MRLSKSRRWWERVSGPGYRSPGSVHAPYFPVPPPDGFIIQKGWKTGKPFITLVFTETFLFALMKWQIGSWEFGRGMFALLFCSGICIGHKYYWRVTLAQGPFSDPGGSIPDLESQCQRLCPSCESCLIGFDLISIESFHENSVSKANKKCQASYIVTG